MRRQESSKHLAVIDLKLAEELDINRQQFTGYLEEAEVEYRYLTHFKARLNQRNLKTLLCCFLKTLY